MGSSGWFLDRRLQAVWPFAAERDAPGALASARAAPNKLTTNLTLSSAERRRFAARTGAAVRVAREQEQAEVCPQSPRSASGFVRIRTRILKKAEDIP